MAMKIDTVQAHVLGVLQRATSPLTSPEIAARINGASESFVKMAAANLVRRGQARTTGTRKGGLVPLVEYEA